MGNWNRRYMPRKKQRLYYYEDLPPSPPRSHSSSGPAGNRVPSWEIDYCHSVKVPWKKVLASKHYIYPYPTVLDWDGSAGKEAFENAKKRFWAKINSLHCDNPLPDPDMYIGEIDWNPHIDHELMADLDLQAFDPDDAEKVEQLETTNEEVDCAQIQRYKNQYTSDNPWERDNVLGNGDLKEEKGWGGWNDTLNLKNVDPREQSHQKLDGNLKDNAWRSGNESWGWPQGIDNNRSSSCGNSWNCNEKTVSVRQSEWGQGHRGNNSCCSRPWNKNAEGMASFQNNDLIGSKERGWRDDRNVSWGVTNAEYQGNEAKNWDPNFRGGRSFRVVGGREKVLYNTRRNIRAPDILVTPINMAISFEDFSHLVYIMM